MSQLDTITFSTGGAALDRAAHLRPQAAELAAREDARLLLMQDGKIAIDLSGPSPRLGWLPAAGAESGLPIFLGRLDNRPVFAATAGEADDMLGADGKFIDLRSVGGELSPVEATVAATAKGVLGWHAIHPFCARCGAESLPEEGGWRRRCTRCGGLHFPRIDPVVIMLVVHGDSVLLGRQAAWREGLHSLLAGYMEPGETIEDAVRREVMEETAVSIGRVRYLACQPWPFPSSLMLGCLAEALTREITVDTTELETALWVTRAEMAEILDRTHPRLASPPVDAIARSILSAWVAGELGAV